MVVICGLNERFALFVQPLHNSLHKKINHTDTLGHVCRLRRRKGESKVLSQCDGHGSPQGETCVHTPSCGVTVWTGVCWDS